MAVSIRCATLADVQPILKFASNLREENHLLLEIPIIEEDSSMWLAECIMSSGSYLFVAEENSEICGFIVLAEMSYPWNSQQKYLADMLFLAKKGGLKLLRTAKALAKKKNIKSIKVSVSSKKQRSDKFLSYMGQYIGGTYEIEV